MNTTSEILDNPSPQTPEGRKFIQGKLVRFAKIANDSGTVTGLRAFYKSIPSEECRQQVLQWLEKYTPIRKSYVNSGTLTFLVPKDLKGSFDLDNAKLNPWYSVNVPNSRPQAKQTTKLPKECGRPLTDREFRRKLLITAVDRFLADPTERTKNKLIGAINGVPMEKPRRGGTPFIQGGAPGLKK